MSKAKRAEAPKSIDPRTLVFLTYESKIRENQLEHVGRTAELAAAWAAGFNHCRLVECGQDDRPTAMVGVPEIDP